MNEKFDTDMTDINILVPVTIDPYLLVKHMIDCMTYEELREFIIMLDEATQDWDFTLMLHDYFDDQYDKYMEEMDTFGR